MPLPHDTPPSSLPGVSGATGAAGASGAASTPGLRVLLAGATGLVGQQCLRLLLQDPAVAEVRALLRRPIQATELLAQAGLAGTAATQASTRLHLCVDHFEHLPQHPDWFAVDAVFCALGTTHNKAGSKAAFRQVDFDFPLQIATLARQQGAQHFLLVSALGADARSPSHYSRVKGELEAAVQALGYASLTIARPSLLAGDRAEFRLAEALGLKLAWAMPERYKPVHVSQVARGLWASAHQPPQGLRILSNTELRTQPTTA